ncbi:hypothetical protein G9A89_020122 [Geosiphon pyriformis]|nr:hypothetical protein G9A89_020122 [Geosiphon pyriformis]
MNQENIDSNFTLENANSKFEKFQLPVSPSRTPLPPSPTNDYRRDYFALDHDYDKDQHLEEKLEIAQLHMIENETIPHKEVEVSHTPRRKLSKSVSFQDINEMTSFLNDDIDYGNENTIKSALSETFYHNYIPNGPIIPILKQNISSPRPEGNRPLILDTKFSLIQSQNFNSPNQNPNVNAPISQEPLSIANVNKLHENNYFVESPTSLSSKVRRSSLNNNISDLNSTEDNTSVFLRFSQTPVAKPINFYPINGNYSDKSKTLIGSTMPPTNITKRRNQRDHGESSFLNPQFKLNTSKRKNKDFFEVPRNGFPTSLGIIAVVLILAIGSTLYLSSFHRPELPSEQARIRPIFKEIANDTINLAVKLAEADIPASAQIFDLRSSCHILRDTIKTHKALLHQASLTSYLDSLGELTSVAGDKLAAFQVKGNAFFTYLSDNLTNLKSFVPLGETLKCGVNTVTLEAQLRNFIKELDILEQALKETLKTIDSALLKYGEVVVEIKPHDLTSQQNLHPIEMVKIYINQLYTMTKNMNFATRMNYIDEIKGRIEKLENSRIDLNEVAQEVEKVLRDSHARQDGLKHMCSHFIGSPEDIKVLYKAKEVVDTQSLSFGEKQTKKQGELKKIRNGRWYNHRGLKVQNREDKHPTFLFLSPFSFSTPVYIGEGAALLKQLQKYLTDYDNLSRTSDDKVIFSFTGFAVSVYAISQHWSMQSELTLFNGYINVETEY